LYAVPGQRVRVDENRIDSTGQSQAGVYKLSELPTSRQGRTTGQHLRVHRKYDFTTTRICTVIIRWRVYFGVIPFRFNKTV